MRPLNVGKLLDALYRIELVIVIELRALPFKRMLG